MIAHRIYRLTIPVRKSGGAKSLPWTCQLRADSTAGTVVISRSEYLKVLGLVDDASPADIKRAYYDLSLRFHPDRNPNDPEAQDKFMAVLEAYERLSDFAVSPAERARRLEEERAETWKPDTSRLDDVMKHVKGIQRNNRKPIFEDPATYHHEDALKLNRELGTQLVNASIMAAVMLVVIGGVRYLETSL